MKVEIWETRTSLLLVVGLLVLAGVISDVDVAWAQSQGTCVPPAGVTAPPDPSVTAQQVEDGTASLQDFALAVRERASAEGLTSVEGGAYFGCLIREDGNAYRSGSTYLVTLTLDGRVYIHAASMALSGRLLNPFIYGEILSGLGVPLTVLADLASPDPGTAAQAFASLFATLSQEPHGGFDATTPVPGLRPGIPGASGYATVYLAGHTRIPTVLLAGFEVDESHLADEVIDYGDPAITAKDVVDRASLKGFVTEAVNYIQELLKSRDDGSGGALVAASQARIALRDPNGPWRHGNVYLYILDRTSNIILFHGAFPDRFELRPLIPTVRDAVTGKLVLPQVIDAATSGPEGGFIEYYFDDPTDDTDRADIPKVGYAREYSGTLLRPDGTRAPYTLIIGSGFYGTAAAALDFAHFANGESISSEMVLVNLAATPIQPLVYFYGRDGELIDPGSMVDVVGNLETTDFGALTLQSELPSLGEITISTNGMGDLVTGSVKVISKDPNSPIGGVLRFAAPGIGVTGAGASQPVRDAIIPVRRQVGGINTGVAFRNLSDSELTLTCLLTMGGETIETQPITLPANGHTAMFLSELFEHDTSEFTGSMRCTAPTGAQEFTGVAVELDAMKRIFTTLPVLPLNLGVSTDEEITPEE